jgi:hypothetical protein
MTFLPPRDALPCLHGVRNPPRRGPLHLAFPVAFALHNLEEAIWLPAWSRTAGVFDPVVGGFEFRFAVLVLTLWAFA